MHPLDPAWQALIAEFETAQARAAGHARSKVSEDLNQTARRLKQYNAESDWYDAVLDGAARFTPETALFAVEGDTFILKGARGLALPPDLVISAAQGAAFRNALDSREVVVALATANEVSEPVASSVPADRALLFPVSNGARVAALLLCVARDGADANALELIVNMASSVLDDIGHWPTFRLRRSADRARERTPGTPPGLGPRSGIRQAATRARTAPGSRQSSRDAVIPAGGVRAGRTQRDIYLFLKREIDSARDIFREQFLATKSMVDYLHLEVLARLARNDNALLGADYPGQMV